MTDIVYHLLVICIAALGIFRGFRRRFTRQVPSVIGFAVAAVCSYVFRFPIEEWLWMRMPDLNRVEGPFVVSTLACTGIYLTAYCVFRFCTAPLSLIFRKSDTGILDNISGAAYGLLNNLMWVSLVCNIIVCVWPGSRLLKYARSDDGDIVHEVMLISPFFISGDDIDDLTHRIQLDEASRIS